MKSFLWGETHANRQKSNIYMFISKVKPHIFIDIYLSTPVPGIYDYHHYFKASVYPKLHSRMPFRDN